MTTRCSFLVSGLAFGLAVTAPGCADGAVEQPPPGLEFASESDLKAQRDAKDATYRTDPDSPIPTPRRADFKALDYYPLNADLRFRVKLRRYPGGLPLTILTTTGKTRPATKVGYVEFRHEGAVHRLQVYHLDDLGPEHGDALFLSFLDATSGRAWSARPGLNRYHFGGVWGTQSEDVFVVGSKNGLGIVQHWNGAAWAETDAGVNHMLTGVHGCAPDDVFAVSEAGHVLHYDGIGWSPHFQAPPGYEFVDVWCVGG